MLDLVFHLLLCSLFPSSWSKSVSLFFVAVNEVNYENEGEEGSAGVQRAPQTSLWQVLPRTVERCAFGSRQIS